MQVEATIVQGQVAIPPAIREALRAEDGDTLVFEADASGVRIRTRQPASFVDYIGLFGIDDADRSIEEILAEEREMRGHC